MSNINIKHFKLTNNDEIVCEVLDWNTGDDIADVVVSKALKVISVEDYMRGIKFFCFRPWLSLQDDPACLQTINSSHIVVTSNPTPDILKHYRACLRGITHELKNRGKTKKRSTFANLDEVNQAIRDMTDDEMDTEYVHRCRKPRRSATAGYTHNSYTCSRVVARRHLDMRAPG